MTTKDCKKRSDIVIIGGGLAGLFSAYLLAKQGIKCTLYEAASVMGGRIKSKRTSYPEFALDLGPSWVFPHQLNIQSVIADLGLVLVDQYAEGPALFQTNKHSAPQQVTGVAPPLMHRIEGGTSQLINVLLDELSKLNCCELKLNSCVESIAKKSKIDDMGKGAWELSFNANTHLVLCEHLIIATPPRVISKAFQRGLISYDGKDIPTHKNELEKLLNLFLSTPTWMAAQAKFIATFDKPFWKESGLSGQAFSHVGPLSEIHDAGFVSERASVNALFGFCGIGAQQRLRIAANDIEEAAKQQLVEIFGENARKPTNTYYYDWATNENVATRKDIIERSVHPFCDLTPHTNWLQENKLYLAGSEFAQQDAGYMEGAIVAATEAISELKKNDLQTQ